MQRYDNFSNKASFIALLIPLCQKNEIIRVYSNTKALLFSEKGSVKKVLVLS
jgi:hypothetical protein